MSSISGDYPRASKRLVPGELRSAMRQVTESPGECETEYAAIRSSAATQHRSSLAPGCPL